MKNMITAIMVLTFAGSLTACSAKSVSGETAPAAESSAGESSIASDDVKAVLGKWDFEYNGDQWVYDFRSDHEAYIFFTGEYDDMYFSPDRSFTLNGKTFSEDDYEFENGKFTLLFEGKSAIEMEKTGHPDDLYGEYLLTGGKYKGRFFKEDDDNEFAIENVFFTMNDDHTDIAVQYVQPGFELKPGKISIQVPGTERRESSYEIDGDTLVITNSSNQKLTFTRKQDDEPTQ